MLKALQGIQIEHPVIAIDTEKDADLWNLLTQSNTDLFKDGFPQIDLLPRGDRFHLKNGAVRIIGGNGRFEAERLELRVSRKERRFLFQGGVTLECTLPRLFGEPASLRGAVRASGECAADFTSGNAVANLSSLVENRFDLKPLTVNIALGDTKISVKKIHDQSAFDFSAGYDLKTRDTSGTFECEGFSPGEIFGFTGAWADYNTWLTPRLSGTASFEGRDGEAVRYTLDISGSLPDTFPDGAFRIHGTGDQTGIEAHTATLRVHRGDVSFQGRADFEPAGIRGTLSFRDFTISGRETVNAHFKVMSEDGTIALKGNDIQIGAVSGARFEGSVSVEERSVVFGASFSYPKPKAEREGAIVLNGFLDYGDSRSVDLNLTLDSLGALEILEFAGPFSSLSEPDGAAPLRTVGYAGDIVIDTTLYITSDFRHLSYHASPLAIAFETKSKSKSGNRGAVFTGTVSGTERYAHLSQGRISWSRGEEQAAQGEEGEQEEQGEQGEQGETEERTESNVALFARAEYTDIKDISFSVGAIYLDTPYYFEGAVLDRTSVSMQGLYGLNVYFGADETGGYSGYIEIENAPVPHRGKTAHFSVKSALRYESPESWNFNLERFEITDVYTSHALTGTALRFSGGADEKGALVQEILFDDGLGALRGAVSAAWNRDFSEVSGEVSLRDAEGAERYAVTGRLTEKAVTLSLDGSEMRFGRFVPLPFNPVVSGEMTLVWRNTESFSATLNLVSFSALIADTEARISGAVSLDTDLARAEDISLRYGNALLDIPALEISRIRSAGSAEARFQMITTSQDMDMSFTAAVTFKPIDSWFNLKDALVSFNGVITVPEARFNTMRLEKPFDVVFSRTSSLIAASGGPDDMIRMRLADTGDFYAGLSKPSPVRGTFVGNIANNTIEAKSNDLYVDLTALWQFIPDEVKQIVAISGGFVTASLQITGPLGDPEFFGSARGNSVRLGVPLFLTRPVRPVPITVTFEGNEMFFGPIPASVGQGKGTVSGSFKFDRWIPNTFNLGIHVPRESPIPFGLALMGVASHGNASGDLTLSLADMILAVSGDLTADETEIILNADEIAAFQQSPDSIPQPPIPVVIDILLKSGRKVEVLWPNAAWPILQATTDTRTSIRLKSDTVTHDFSIAGNAHIRGGEIFYFERSFYIRQGVIAFNENQNRFEPRISVRAEVRDQVNTGPVTIAMIVDNAPLQSFTARFEASPPLSQIEIFSLLGQNITGISTEGESDQIPLLTSGTDFLASYVYRRFQRWVRDMTPLDMLSFRTQLGQNLLIQGIRRSQDRETTEKSTSGIGNYFDNTTVFIGKYLTSDMFFQGMVSLRYNENRIVLNSLTWGDYTLEPDFGLELRGPLFDIQVHVPLLHFESLFVADISFSLVRRRSNWGDMFRFP
jgi:hypothetical protein